MARSAASPSVEEDSLETTPEVTPEATPEVLPEEEIAPVEYGQFLQSWINDRPDIEAEALGGFTWYAKQMNWHGDTPSGWNAKFQRWINSSA